MIPNAVGVVVVVVVLAFASVVVQRVARPAAFVAHVHNAVWAGTLVLVATGLVAYDPVTPTAWATLAVGVAAFNVAVGLVGARAATRADAAEAEPTDAPSSPALVGRRGLAVLGVLYGAAFVVYAVIQVTRVGLAEFLADPGSIRDFGGVTNLEATPVAIRALLFLGPLLFALLAAPDGVRRHLPLAVRLGLAAAVLASMAALLQRTNLFLAVLLLVAALVLRASRGSGRGARGSARGLRAPAVQWALAGVGAAVILVGSFQIIGIAVGKRGTNAIAAGTVSTVLEESGLTSPFVYLTGGVPAFLHLVDAPESAWPAEPPGVAKVGDYDPQLWGAASFEPLLRFIPGAPHWSPIEPFIDNGVTINVYTWLGPAYRDFRVLGVAGGMLAIGAGAALAYVRRTRSGRWFWLSALAGVAIALSVFVAPTQYGMVYIVLIGAVLVATSGRILSALRAVRRRLRPGGRVA